MPLTHDNVVDGALVSRRLPDGRLLALQPLLFDRLRLTAGRDPFTYENFW